MDDGSFNGGVQTPTLTVTGGVATDTTYKCEIHGSKYDASINVYSVAQTSVDSLESISATVGCTVTGITTALTGIKWYDSSDGALTDTSLYTVADGALSGDKQTTTLTVINGVGADTTYQCEIHGTKYTAAINVYSVAQTSVDSLASFSATVGCTVTGITTELTGIKWYDSGSTELPTDGSYTMDDGSLVGDVQTTTLTVTNGVASTMAYKCEIHGSKYDASIIVYTVTIERPSKITSAIDTTITCKVKDASQTVAITWYDNSDNLITADNTNYITNDGSQTGSLQSATLTIKPAMLDTLPKDTELTYKCGTKSGNSPLFKSPTKFTIITFGVEGVPTEVLANTEAVLSCRISGITKAVESVTWQNTAGDTLSDGDSYQISPGSYAANTQTTELTIKQGHTPADHLYTCLVTSTEQGVTGQLTTVQLGVFEMTLQDTEVLKGKAVTATCTVTGVSVDPELYWTVGDQDYKDASDTVYKVTVDPYKPAEDTKASKLEITAVNDDILLTCVTVVDGKPFTKTVQQKVYGLHGHDEVVLTGATVTLSCTVDGYHDAITSSQIHWYKDGQPLAADADTWEETSSGDPKEGVTKLVVVDVQQDAEYTCFVEIDGETNERSFTLDAFSITSVNDVVTTGDSTLARLLIDSLDAKYNGKVTITWTDSNEGAVPGHKLKQYIYPKDGLEMSGIVQDTSYTGSVSVAVTDDVTRTFPADQGPGYTVLIDRVEFVKTADYIVKTGTASTLQCELQGAKTNPANDMATWTLSGSSGWQSAVNTNIYTNTKQQVDYATDEGEWVCGVSWDLSSSAGITRLITATLNLDIPAITKPPDNQFSMDGETVTFTCEARTTEPRSLAPTYAWYKGGVEVQSEVSTTFEVASPEDDVIVNCSASYDDDINNPPDPVVVVEKSAKVYTPTLAMVPSGDIYGVTGEELEITCTYTSGFNNVDNMKVSNGEGVIEDSTSGYRVVEGALTTTLTIEPATMTIALQDTTYTCEFTIDNDAKDELIQTATVKKVFEIDPPPVQPPDFLSGLTATFSLTVSTHSTFTLSYEWYEAGTPGTILDTTDSFTTVQLMSADGDNTYQCKVTWTADKQTLTTTTVAVGVSILDSCELTGGADSRTERGPELNIKEAVGHSKYYVADADTINISCVKGNIVPGNGIYQFTCSADSTIAVQNCQAGCWIDRPTDGDLYHGAIEFPQNHLTGPDSYVTVHAGTTTTITCKTGYVVSSTTAVQVETCPMSLSDVKQIDLSIYCKQGCKLTDRASAELTGDSVTQGVEYYIAPQDTYTYTCPDNKLTTAGKNVHTTGVCSAGIDISLDECLGVEWETSPSETVGISYLELKLTQPRLEDGGVITFTSPTYTCKVKELGSSQVQAFNANNEDICVMTSLEPDSSFSYSVTVTMDGASWVSGSKEFQTKKPYSGTNEDGTISLEKPPAYQDVERYDIIAVWFKDPLEATSYIKFDSTLGRKRRSAAVSISVIQDNFNSFSEFKATGASFGAFWVALKFYSQDLTLYPGDLDLPAGETYVLAAKVCNPQAQLTDCVIGSGTQYVTAPDRTVGIVVGVVVALLVVGLLGGLLLVYKRYPHLLQRTPKTGDADNTVFVNPEHGAGTDNELGVIDRRAPDPIHVADFLSTYRRLMQDTEYLLDREYDEIKAEVTDSMFHFTQARKPENKIKNRYTDIIPYDETRVKLQTSVSHPSDYINANFVSNMDQQCEFIAAQGPKEETLVDFWQMVWENKSRSIIMVTNLVERGRRKCAQYWSDEGTMQYGDMRVTVDGMHTFPDYCIRTLKVEKGKETRDIYHFFYLVWPDHGAPPSTTSLIDFSRRCFAEAVDGPVVVHCSAGVGRTGTLIALHLQMRMLAHEQRVDLFGIVCNLRRSRKLTVQTVVQYKFLYQAVREMIICDDTFISAREFHQELARLTAPRSGNQYMTLLDDQFKRLEEYCQIQITPDKKEYKTEIASSGVNHSKNRFSNVLPYDSNRVKLRVTTGESGSDYINASYINGYNDRDKFIATQGPKQNTIGDFWRMVFEKDVSTIVMLTPLVDRGRERCSMYWPRTQDEPIALENITVHLVHVYNPTTDYTVRTFSIAVKNYGHGEQEETTRQIKQFHYHSWTSSESPSSGDSIIRMIEQVRKQNKAGPIVVHCSAGIGRTAVFMATYNCIDQLFQDEMIDLFTVVLRLRLQRNGMVQNVDQYAFTYRIMAEYCSKHLDHDYINAQELLEGR